MLVVLGIIVKRTLPLNQSINLIQYLYLDDQVVGLTEDGLHVESATIGLV